MKLQGDIETLQHEVLDLKGRLASLEDDKCTWEKEKKNMKNRIDELNDYSTHEDRSPTALAIKDMPEMPRKDLEGPGNHSIEGVQSRDQGKDHC